MIKISLQLYGVIPLSFKTKIFLPDWREKPAGPIHMKIQQISKGKW
jgi:hypothetical protein